MVDSARGSLRVYLGAAPGVGKTFAMLDEGSRRAARGTDVVVGIVETHGRPRTTERLEGLEVVPRRAVEHRGTTQHEMDLEAVLRRAPDVCLVDELAHSNVPGLDHAKRWQDVETLLAAGIDVVTTVNIQHLESLNDVTEAITGVRQRETVPDRFVRSADAIELVDMSPQALRRRLAHGNVYAAEKVDAALGQFFREGNLAALRELALLWLADRVDEGLDRYRAQHSIDSTWAARERIVVGVTGGPESESLMRRASRIASRTGGGEWHALYVTRGDGLRQTGPERLEALRRTTEELGGTFHTVVGDDSAAGILDYARGVNASQVLVGASRRGRISTLLRPGIGETVIAESGDIDVHIVTHAEARRSAAVLRQQGALG
ncbi:MAG: histidine kinase, partial [Actinomycetales bacterium]